MLNYTGTKAPESDQVAGSAGAGVAAVEGATEVDGNEEEASATAHGLGKEGGEKDSPGKEAGKPGHIKERIQGEHLDDGDTARCRGQ